jgi:ribosomal protein L37AE/L43A
MTPDTDADDDRDSIRECPECGQNGHQAWVLGHWHCPTCDLTYDDSGSPDVTQI